MTKFVLFFVALFFIVQICYAEKRTVRDVAEDAKAAVDKAGDAIKDFLSPETWDKIVAGAKDFGNNVKKVADDLVQKVSEKAPETPST